MSRAKRIAAWGLFTLALMLLSGWLLADHFTPRAVGAPSRTLPLQAAQTALDREIVPLLAKHAGKTGAILVPDGLDAFAARAISARQAGRSLDLQYYIWHDDLTGHLLGREAWLAAERGVRVRILVDDMNAAGKDVGLLALDAHRNIEVRLYNPFRNRDSVWRMLELVQRIFSVNHRMHNKAWIADGRVAVLGGRNIGEEYFDAASSTNFRDLDVVLFGPAVRQASTIFDDYWNSAAVVPIAALSRRSPRDLGAAVLRVRAEAAGPAARRYLQRVDGSDSVRGYFARQLAPHWSARISVIADPPLKWRQDGARGRWLVDTLEDSVRATRRKALLISPYFVPGDAATQELVGLVRQRQAYVGVITNSLAANDVVAVHAGYRNYRDALLDGGVHLHEIRSQRPAGAGAGTRWGSSGASLHTKAFVIDDRHGFIGSFNLDPRSATLNTEMGVLFDDAGIAAALRDEYLRLSAPEISYLVFRDQAGQLRWLDRSGARPRLHDHEPDSTRLQRLGARVLGWLPIESQL